MALDVLLLALVALAAGLGAASGAARQLVQLGAALLAWWVARRFGAPVAEGLDRSMPGFAARALAPALLFAGIFAAGTLLGALLLRLGKAGKVVAGPADRAAGALLGGAKAVVMLWVLLSAAALVGGPVGRGSAKVDPGASELGSLAAEHNLLRRLEPGAVERLEELREKLPP